MSVAGTVRSNPVMGGYRVWQRNRDAFLRSWRVELGGFTVDPIVMLVVAGYGIGKLVGDIGDLRYVEYLAPGVVASYAMFHASMDSTYGAYLRMETHHIYEAVLFTPLSPRDIVLGEVMWSASRSVLSGTAVLIIASILGLVDSPLAILALPCAFLIGFAFASIAMMLTATATTLGAMNNFFTLFILPMFWLGGVFFPLDRLPDGVEIFAWALPLTPGAALVRGLVTGDPSLMMLAWAAELIAYSVVAFFLASSLMKRRLIK